MARIIGDVEPNDLTGGEEEDLMRGRAGADTMRGDDGDDTLEGGFGKDSLDGGIGKDVLRGEKDDDVLIGDNGDDDLFGGNGDDVFLFESGEGDDDIGDFEVDGGDKVRFDIPGLSFNDLEITNKKGNAFIKWDDPDGASITLEGVDAASLTRSEFMFDN